MPLLDCVYYATVSLSTTGYGDITPLTPQARLVNILVITPLRAFSSSRQGLVTVQSSATKSDVLHLAGAMCCASLVPIRSWSPLRRAGRLLGLAPATPR